METYAKHTLEELGEALAGVEAIVDVLCLMNTETCSQGAPEWCGNRYLVDGLTLGIKVIADRSKRQLESLREHMEDWPNSINPLSKSDRRWREFVLFAQDLPEARREELFDKLMELRALSLDEERSKEEARRREAAEMVASMSDSEQERLYKELSEIFSRPPGNE